MLHPFDAGILCILGLSFIALVILWEWFVWPRK